MLVLEERRKKEGSSHLEQFSQVLSKSKIQPVLYEFESRKSFEGLIHWFVKDFQHCEDVNSESILPIVAFGSGELEMPIRRTINQRIDYLLFVFFSSIERPRFDILFLRWLSGGEPIKAAEVTGWKNGRLKGEEVECFILRGDIRLSSSDDQSRWPVHQIGLA